MRAESLYVSWFDALSQTFGEEIARDFIVEVHGREVRCLSRGDAACEFIMAPSARLDEYEARLRSGWS